MLSLTETFEYYLFSKNHNIEKFNYNINLSSSFIIFLFSLISLAMSFLLFNGKEMYADSIVFFIVFTGLFGVVYAFISSSLYYFISKFFNYSSTSARTYLSLQFLSFSPFIILLSTSFLLKSMNLKFFILFFILWFVLLQIRNIKISFNVNFLGSFLIFIIPYFLMAAGFIFTIFFMIATFISFIIYFFSMAM